MLGLDADGRMQGRLEGQAHMRDGAALVVGLFLAWKMAPAEEGVERHESRRSPLSERRRSPRRSDARSGSCGRSVPSKLALNERNIFDASSLFQATPRNAPLQDSLWIAISDVMTHPNDGDLRWQARAKQEQRLDDELKQTFPASDTPSQVQPSKQGPAGDPEVEP